MDKRCNSCRCLKPVSDFLRVDQWGNAREFLGCNQCSDLAKTRRDGVGIYANGGRYVSKTVPRFESVEEYERSFEPPD